MHIYSYKRSCNSTYMHSPPHGQDETDHQFLRRIEHISIQSFPSPIPLSILKLRILFIHIRRESNLIPT